MAGGSNGYPAALVRRERTPGLISSLPGTAGLPPFISFSTSYAELDSAVRRAGGDGSRQPTANELQGARYRVAKPPRPQTSCTAETSRYHYIASKGTAP
jgi:hypothetical protein